MNETEFEQYLRIIFTSLNVVPSKNDKIDFHVLQPPNQTSLGALPSHTGQQNFSDRSNASNSRSSSRSLDSSDLSSIDSIGMFSDINEGRRNRDKQQITHLRNLLHKQNLLVRKYKNLLDKREQLFKINTQGISKLNEENDALRMKVQEKKNRINHLQTQTNT